MRHLSTIVFRVLFPEIVDGNAKMTLGMIWTIILRFAIQDISVEGNLCVHVCVCVSVCVFANNISCSSARLQRTLLICS